MKWPCQDAESLLYGTWYKPQMEALYLIGYPSVPTDPELVCNLTKGVATLI